METNLSNDLVKTRKAYKITKQREKWTDEEHNKFLEAIGLYGRAWHRIHEHINTKTAVQIRSHAQKYFLKFQKGVVGICPAGYPHGIIEIPPPRPKRKTSHPADELIKVNNFSETSACSSTDKVVMEAKGKKPAAHAIEESGNQAFGSCNSFVSANSEKNSAHPLPEYLSMIQHFAVNNTGEHLDLFEMTGNFTPENMCRVQKQMNEPFTSPKHTLLGEESCLNNISPQFKGAKCCGSAISASFIEPEQHQVANADLNLSLSSATSSVTCSSKDPGISSFHHALPSTSTSLFDECHKNENASFLKHHAELARSFTEFSKLQDTNNNVGEVQDKHSSNMSAIILATIEAAASWWRLQGLLSSSFPSNISSAAQAMVPTKASEDPEADSVTIDKTKWKSCSTLLEPSSSSSCPAAVEKIIVERTEKPPNQYILSSLIVEGINEVNQDPSKRKQHPSPCDLNTSPFSEAQSDRQRRNAGRFNKPFNERPYQGPIAFEAIFSQKVLPQSFGPPPPHMVGGKPDLSLGGEEALGLKIDLNTKIFTEIPERSKGCTENWL